jgi:uroporphyrinogen decarboxylase
MSLGTPEEVRREVERRVADFAPGGGFVFASVHNIQSDVRPENVAAFFAAALEFGKY